MGDMNAKLNGNRQGLEDIMGPHGSFNDINENSDRLTSFCNTNSLCIGNTYHPHRSIHKKTWRSPAGQAFNEIDYICISKRWRSSLQNVRVFREADAGSDHYLLLGKIKIIFKKLKKSQTTKASATEKLSKQNVKDEYIIKLQNRFNMPQDHQEIEDQWKMISESFKECAEITSGRRRGIHKEQWIQGDAWKLIDERKQAKIMREQAKSEGEKTECCTKYRELDKKSKK